jgi:acylphosphatase
VQGVFYRATCADVARRLGLVGWVRNLPDGSVEAVAEGPSNDVEALLAWCRQGPPLAAVERLDVTEEDPTGGDGFRVIH